MTSHSHGLAVVLAVATGLTAALGPVRADASLGAKIDAADGKSYVVESLVFEPGWKLRGMTKDGAWAMSAGEIASIHFSNRKAPPRPRGYKLLFHDGGWLGAGTLSLKDDQFKVRSETLGEGTFAIAVVRAVVVDAETASEQLDRLLALAADRDAKADRILYRNGDLALGTLLSIDDRNVVFERAQDRMTQTVGRELVTGVAFDPSLAGKTSRPTMYGQLRLADGNTLLVDSATGKGDTLTVQASFGATFKVAVADLVELTIRGGGTVYLSDLKALEAKAENYVGQPIRPFVADRCAAGGDLVVQGRTFAKGIGTRSQSRIAYDIAGFKRFEAIAALDDVAGELASVRFLVMLDGKVAFDGGESTPETEPRAIRLDLTGKSKLELIVEFAKRADAEDFADWCDARLFK